MSQRMPTLGSMSLEVRWTGYGRPAAVALHRAVAHAKAGDPLAPVTVVVPSNHVGVASRRLLASGALGPVAGTGVGLAAVTFLTVYRLAELLGASTLAAQGKRPVSTPVLAAAMRAELTAGAGLFEPVREHPATESALVATYRELRDLSTGALDALAGTSDRAGEVVRLHRAARARLADAWSDEEDLLDAAAGVAGEQVAAELGALVVHLPQRISRHGGRLIAALAEHVSTTLIAGTTGDEAADAEVRTSLSRMGVGSEQLAAPVVGLPVATDRTTVLTASDADEEVRAAVRAVVDAARAGTRLDRIAVLHASPEPYARLAHEQLAAAGMHTNGAAVVPLSARTAGRTLLDLLALPAGGFRRQDVFAWLAAAPILVGDRWAPTTAWERISRDAAVVAGRDQWNQLLTRHAEQQEHRAEQAERDDDVDEWVADRARETARRARALRSFVLDLMSDLGVAAQQPRRWSEQAAWAHRRLARLLGGPARRGTWPEVEQRAAERVDQAIDRLGALDGVEGPVPLEVFARTLTVELESDLGRVGRFGDGVLVGSVEMGIGIDLDLVVVLGMAEGSFPATVRDDALLPDRERSAAAGELGLRAERVERQHRQLLGALAGAAQQVLCVPRGDLRRSAERVPSRWVLDLATQLDASGQRWWAADLLGADHPWVRHVASFDAGLRASPVPATAQEHRLRTLMANGGDLDALGDPCASAGAEVVGARRSDRFTRFDGNLAGLAMPSPIDRVMSPTRLERWAGCPHAHLVLDLLGANPVENPEDELVITPIDKGNLIHEALERFIDEVLARPEADRPEPLEPWSPQDHRRLQEIGSACCDDYEGRGLVGRPIFWRRDRRRILLDLDRALLCDSAHRRHHGTSPLAVELAFGIDGTEPVTFPLPDGRVLRIRGRADRVDVAADGSLHVIDYKTGSLTTEVKKLGQDDPVRGGTKLQLPVYGLAGRLHHGSPDARVHAEYWFVTRRGGFERVGYEVTDDVLAVTSDVLGTIVAGIEAGAFPPHPEPHTSTWFRVACDVCDPDGLGTTELRRQWERKRHDPAVAAYAELAEPTPPGDDAEGAA
jgi:ATP-dependent helicase/nuclease subunit B